MLENMTCEDLDLSRFCDMTPVPPHELTEEELQQLEQRADCWYLGLCNTLEVL